MHRRLQLIILGHVWVLVPVALAWFARPAWRGQFAPRDAGDLAILAGIAAAYLVARTWLTAVRWTPQMAPLWPYADIGLVTAALVILRSPTDPLSVLYFIPLASAVASLNIPQLVAVGGATAAAYLGAIVSSGVPWTIGMAYRLVILVLIASLYGWIIRLVTTAERAKERAEYQTALSREIHDGIQHLLVTMGARLELARRLVAEAPDRAASIIEEERETARRAADELRYLVRRLHATAQADLATALQGQIAATAERWPFGLEIDVPAALPRLAPAAEHAVLRVIQEGLTNASKHAQASRVAVRITAEDGRVWCTIADNGAGFDPVAVNGSGLQGLRERVRSVGGTLEVRSERGHGATLVASFPLPDQQRRWKRSES